MKSNSNKFTYDHAGVPIYCELLISSKATLKCSLVEHAPNIGSVFFDVKDPEEDLRVYLFENGVKELKKAIHDWESLRAEMREVKIKIQAENARFIAAGIKAGYTHLTTAVVHPKFGDDYVVRMLTNGQPIKREISKLLKRSVVKDDYKVEVLEPAAEAVA